MQQDIEFEEAEFEEVEFAGGANIPAPPRRIEGGQPAEAPVGPPQEPPQRPGPRPAADVPPGPQGFHRQPANRE